MALGHQQLMMSFGGEAFTPVSLLASESATGDPHTNTTAAIDTTGATLLVIGVAYFNVAPPTISDNQSNTWSVLTEYASGAGNGRVRIYYVANPTTNASHTFTASATISYNSIAVAAFDNTAPASVFDAENGAGSASATTQQPGSVTPAANDSLLVTALQYVDTSAPGSATIDSSFTLLEATANVDNFSVALAYKVQTTAGAENPTWSSNTAADRIAAAIAVFKHS